MNNKTALTTLLLFLMIALGSTKSIAQLQDGLYGGLAPGLPQTGFITKRANILSAPVFLTLMNCDYTSGRREVIAQDTNEIEGRKRIRIKPNGKFRKAFQWQASDGTDKTSVIQGRQSGVNKMRVKLTALAAYSDPDPDVDVSCYGTSVYRMRYLGSN